MPPVGATVTMTLGVTMMFLPSPNSRMPGDARSLPRPYEGRSVTSRPSNIDRFGSDFQGAGRVIPARHGPPRRGLEAASPYLLIGHFFLDLDIKRTYNELFNSWGR